MAESFNVTLVASIKHADLRAAVQRFGGQRQLSEAVGVSHKTMHDWCNLRNCPPVTDEEVLARGGHWTIEKRDRVAKALVEITGKTLDELFPPAIRNNREWLKMSKTREEVREIPVDRLLAYGSRTAARLSAPLPSASSEHAELSEAIDKALRKLTYRQREIAKARFGLDGGTPLRRGEVAKRFGVGKERVRQIEAKALRLLQQDRESFVSVAPCEWLEPPPKFEAPKDLSLRQIVEAKRTA